LAEVPIHRQKSTSFRIAGAFLLTIAAACCALPPAASAQGLFDFMFGRRSAPSYQNYPSYQRYPNYPSAYSNAYADPRYSDDDYGERRSGGEFGAHASYCVRLCDGRYFPIPRGGANAAQTCNSLCPASKTKIFSGSGIGHASASDGGRYSDIENAFVYRDRLVAGCTCNGKTAYGLARLDASDDPTLRKGDIVATTDGLLAYQGGRKNVGEFTPVEPSGLTKAWRDNFANLKVQPAAEAAPNDAPVLQPRQSRTDNARIAR
jgi:hypothetical protein